MRGFSFFLFFRYERDAESGKSLEVAILFVHHPSAGSFSGDGHVVWQDWVCQYVIGSIFFSSVKRKTVFIRIWKMVRKEALMDEWTKLTRDRVFISDIGNSQVAEINGTKTLVGRYAVWAPATGGAHHQVVEVGSDCEALMKKYRVPGERVLRLQTVEAGHG